MITDEKFSELNRELMILMLHVRYGELDFHQYYDIWNKIRLLLKKEKFIQSHKLAISENQEFLILEKWFEVCSKDGIYP